MRFSFRPYWSKGARRRLPILALLVVTLPLVGNGAPDEAGAIAVKLKQRYAGIRDLRADFVQLAQNASLGREERSSGWVSVQRPGRMRWEYLEPIPRVIVVDGGTLRIFSPEEAQLQLVPLSEGAFSPTAIAFLLGDLDLDRVFAPELPAQERPGRRGLVLRPREPAVFEVLEVWLDPESYQVRESVVRDLFGNRTELRFTKTRENIGVEELVFTLEVPEGTDVIDLRP